MRWVFVLLLIGLGVVAYLYFNPPSAGWNFSFGGSTPAPVPVSAPAPPPAPDSTYEPATNTPPPPLTTAEVISPNSTNFVNPDHVRDVPQPTQNHFPTLVTNAFPTGTNAAPTPDAAPAGTSSP